MPEQSAEVRKHNFKEVSLGFDAETAKAEAARCLHCKNPLCRTGCPVSVNIPEFIAAIKYDDLDSAASIIKETNNLPAICGRVCPQESQCESQCVLQKTGGAVAIGALERFVGDYALANPKPVKSIDKNGKRVAVIGSGPAGLSCAADCAKAGYTVTVFEAFHRAGGVLVYGIPEFRLPKQIVQAEIDGLSKLGVTIKKNTVIGRTITLQELRDEYDYIFIGTGAGLPTFLKIKGENLPGVYSANEYLTRVNLMRAYLPDAITPVKRGKKVLVVGGGNVAMDSARTALRMGAESVKIVYRRTRNEMPARAEEIHHAEQEGIEFVMLTAPLEILGEKCAEGMLCQQCELVQVDGGRAKPVPIEGAYVTLEADQIIIAVGTTPNPLIPRSTKELSVTPRGTIVIDERGKTSLDCVFSGGDAVSGAATVILAMGAGKTAAKNLEN